MLTTRTCVHTHNFVCTSCSYRSSAVARRATHPNCTAARPYQSIVDQCHCGCAGYNTLSRLLPPHVFAFHTDPAWEDSNAIRHYHRSVHDIRGNYSPASCVRRIDREQTSSRTTCKSRRNHIHACFYIAKLSCDCAMRVRHTFC